MGTMLQVKSRPLTVHDYRELPEDGRQFQLIEGELHLSSSPNRFHQTICRRILVAIAKYLEEQGRGEVYAAPFDVELTDINVYQPDVAYFSHQRASYLTEQGARGAPDLVVEILSPATSRFDLGVKREVYARTGVQELWIVDPATKLIHVYRLAENAETPAATLGEGKTLTTPLLLGLEISVSAIFRR